MAMGLGMLFVERSTPLYNTRAREKSVKSRRKIWPTPKKSLPLHRKIAPVAKLVDALDLGSSVSRRVGSSPIRRTTAIPTVPFRAVGIFFFRQLLVQNVPYVFAFSSIRKVVPMPTSEFFTLILPL